MIIKAVRRQAVWHTFTVPLKDTYLSATLVSPKVLLSPRATYLSAILVSLKVLLPPKPTCMKREL